MTTPHHRSPLGTYLDELAELRVIDPDLFAKEIEWISPVWIVLKVVPGV